jgi:hypothetical protein
MFSLEAGRSDDQGVPESGYGKFGRKSVYRDAGRDVDPFQDGEEIVQFTGRNGERHNRRSLGPGVDYQDIGHVTAPEGEEIQHGYHSQSQGRSDSQRQWDGNSAGTVYPAETGFPDVIPEMAEPIGILFDNGYVRMHQFPLGREQLQCCPTGGTVPEMAFHGILSGPG